MRMTRRISNPGARFLRSLRLGPNLQQILLRLRDGDQLIFYILRPQPRIMLHSKDPHERITIEVSRNTAEALVLRGLLYHAESEQGDYVYRLTEEGEAAARVLENPPDDF